MGRDERRQPKEETSAQGLGRRVKGCNGEHVEFEEVTPGIENSLWETRETQKKWLSDKSGNCKELLGPKERVSSGWNCTDGYCGHYGNLECPIRRKKTENFIIWTAK